MESTTNPIIRENCVNQYVREVALYPEQLAACYEGMPSTQELSAFHAKLSAYDNLYVELCCGSGEHLLSKATKDPRSLYVGFELRYKRAVRTVEKAVYRNLGNVFVLRCDCRNVKEMLPEDSLDGLYINFPDPWGKRKWLKHRVLTKELLLDISTLLKPSAFFSYKTDHTERFEEVASWISQMSHFCIRAISRDMYKSVHIEQNTGSEFETLFRSKGIPVCYLVADLFGKSDSGEV